MKYVTSLGRGQPVVGLFIISVILLSIPRTPTVRYQGMLPRPRRLLEITEGMVGLHLGKPAGVGLAVDLVHNLTSPSPEWLRNFYLGQIAAMLNSTAQMRWVRPHARDRLCSCFTGHGAGAAVEVALVGNGPLSAEQRKDIAAKQCIVRFNQLESRAGPDDRTDIWFVRGAPGWYLPSTPGTTEQVGREVQGIVVAERNARGKFAAKKTAVVEAAWEAPLAAFPAAVGLSGAELQGKVLPLELGAHYTLWFSITKDLGFHNWSYPSSGFVGLILALDCLPSDGAVHLYGFNWSPDNWHRHVMEVEQSFVQLIAQLYDGRVVVHPTPCGSLRTCR